MQEEKRSFITFHDGKPLEPLIKEKWEEFNIKVNTTIPEILQWVSNEHVLYVAYSDSTHHLLAHTEFKRALATCYMCSVTAVDFSPRSLSDYTELNLMVCVCVYMIKLLCSNLFDYCRAIYAK